MRQIMLVGATGLIGSQVRQLLRASKDCALHSIVRRKPDASNDYIEQALSDAELDSELSMRLRERLSGQRLDTFVCCLGTTIKDAGSKEAFLAVDRELVLRMARIAKELGARKAVIVSSVGADRGSSQFYLRVKGETEDLLEALRFEQLIVLRPGLLIGARKQHRAGEALAQKIQPLVDGLLLGRWRRYRSVDSAIVAAAITNAVNSVTNSPGITVWEHDQIVKTAQAKG
jgi:uncharacterized protein YbjT (DUF2867 family)